MKKVILLMILMAMIATVKSQTATTEVPVTNSEIVQSATAEQPVTYPEIALYLLAFAGIVCHILFKYMTAYQSKEFFDWGFNGLMGLIGVIISCVIIYTRGYVDFYLINPFTAFLLGYSWDSIFKNITGIVKKK